MPRLLSVEDLLDAVATSGSLLLLPSAHAAEAMRQAHDARVRGAGKAVWKPLHALSWGQWLRSLWGELVVSGHEMRLLLNQAQERFLWRQIIAADAGVSRLFSLDALAALAQSAGALAGAYRAASLLRSSAHGVDARSFAAWHERFNARCVAEKLLPAAQLEDVLAEHVRRGTLAAPATVMLCGFLEWTPAQGDLLRALEERGSAMEEITLTAAPAENAVRAAVALPDQASELRAGLCWLRGLMEASAHDEKQAARFALLVPELEAERAELEPVLRDVLAPELNDVSADVSATPWRFHAGAPLAETMRVALLLDLARWVRGPLPLARVSELVLAPCFVSAADRAQRARFDTMVLQRLLPLRPEISLRAATAHARQRGFVDIAAWLGRMDAHAASATLETQRKSFSEWMEFLRTLAALADEPHLDEETAWERGLREAFDGVLDLVATLDFAGRRVTFAEACDAVEREAAAMTSPTQPGPALLEIMHPEEAAGQSFDAVVYLRATDGNLPPRVQPHPLLEWTLQRRLRMPGADPEADRARTQEAVKRLLMASAQVLFTCAQEDEDGKLRASTLPARLGCETIDPVELAGKNEAEPEAVQLVAVADRTPLPPLPETTLSGGSRLLKLQAACGFLAFAELRLCGRTMERKDAGFSALESGSHLHEALEAFWKEVRSQRALREMNIQQREEAVERAVAKALSIDDQKLDRWDEAYLAVQRERMKRLLLAWLEFELQRGDFTVLESEFKGTVDVGPLRLDVRVDRIDRVPAGEGENGFVLVDYKSGNAASLRAWASERPDEPQLPLYTLLGDANELRGVTFAKIRNPGEMKWIGIAAEDGILPGRSSKVEDLAEHAAAWRGVLDAVAQDFFDGKADVAPKNYAVNCKHCGQRLLCRVNMESLYAASGNDELETGGDEAEDAGDASF